MRLYPALLIVLLLTIILTPFVYQGDVPFYYNKSLLTYLPNNLSLYRIQYVIDGVFEKNPYKSIINGSLWTIPYEFTMYILLSFLIRHSPQKKLKLLFIDFPIFIILNQFAYKYLN